MAFVEAHTPVGEPPEVDMLLTSDSDENLGDMQDLLASIGCEDALLGDQAWVDYCSPEAFDRFFLGQQGL